MDSGLPWLWITEYLAGFKEIDTAILHGMHAQTQVYAKHGTLHYCSEDVNEILGLLCFVFLCLCQI